MAVKAVELIRKIRDKHYKETRGLSAEKQIKFTRRKSVELQKNLKRLSVQLQITQCMCKTRKRV